jgi:gamma-glutamyltranspeptidase/glutathione hydrolase
MGVIVRAHSAADREREGIMSNSQKNLSTFRSIALAACIGGVTAPAWALDATTATPAAPAAAGTQVQAAPAIATTTAQDASAKAPTSAQTSPATSQPAPAAETTALTPLARYDLGQTIFAPITAKQGMVASENALATRIGIEILKQGGNAIDAAVAVGFALAVAMPNAGNIGGGGFMMIHDAHDQRDVALDFREVAPAAAHANLFLDADGKVIKDESLYTHRAVGVPGTVAGLLTALDKYGSLSRAKVMAPAIALAKKGYPVSDSLPLMLATEADHLGKWPASRKIFFKEITLACTPKPCTPEKRNVPLAAGDILRQPDLALSLEAISRDGARAFYEGDIAKKIVAEMKRDNGIITLDDLRQYKAIERVPVTGTYHDYRIMSMPPPSSGGVHIIQMLNILERYPLRDYGALSAQTIHLMVESMKLAYADRAQYLGDPDFIKVPVKGLISKGYADVLAGRIDARRASVGSTIKPGNPLPYESDETTQFTVADKTGNVVSATYTLNLNFGSGIVADGTGILLNDEMDDFAAKPGVPNAYGLLGGDANAVGPGKRPLSSMSPVIVFKNDKPWLATGSPGGSRIITTVLETLVDSIDFDMNPAEAAATPRFHHQGLPDILRMEKGISPDTQRVLRSMGHKIEVGATMGRTQTIKLIDGGFEGASDPRDPDGLTAGY